MAGVSDIDVIAETIADGPPAQNGDTITYSARFFLRRGDEVTPDYASITRYGEQITTREVDGVRLIEHETILGKRRTIAGVEQMLTGLSPGSYREAVIPPHLAYGKKGLGDLIPPNAMLRVRLWVHTVESDK